MRHRRTTVLTNILRWIFPLFISALAFWFILRQIELSEFLTNLSKIGVKALLLSSLVYLASLLFRVSSWYFLLRRNVTFKDTFFTMNAGYLLNNVFPFRLGEVGRALLLADPKGPSVLEVFSSVIVERVFDVFLAALFVLAMLPRILVGDFNDNLVLLVFLIAFTGILILFMAARYQNHINGWLICWGERRSFIQRWIQPKFEQLLTGLSVLNNPIMFFLAFGSLFISWILAFVQNLIIFQQLYIDPPFWWMVFILSVGAFGIALPSAPAGLGVFEGAVVAAFALLDVDAGIALAHALIIHGMSVVYNNVFGLIGLHLRGEALIDLYHRAIHRTPEVQKAD